MFNDYWQWLRKTLGLTVRPLVHDAVVAATSDTQALTATDGRTLVFAEWDQPV